MIPSPEIIPNHTKEPTTDTYDNMYESHVVLSEKN